jgi:hypothetical protein
MTAKQQDVGKAEHASKFAKPSVKPSPKRSYKTPAVKRDRKLASVTGVPLLSGQDG